MFVLNALFAQSSPSSLAVPWLTWRRGLAVAGVLSLMAHGLTLNVLNQGFDFKFSERSGTASLNTRVIQASSQPQAGIQPAAPARAAQSVSSNAVPAAADQNPSPQPLLEPQSAPRPVPQPAPQLEDQNLEQKLPVAGEYSAQSATETIATLTPSTPTSGSGSAAAQPSMAVRLQYPPNAQLEFEALNVRRAQSTTGSGQLSWKSDGQQYELVIESSVLGLTVLTQKSVGVLDAMGLAPERYSDKRLGRSEQAAHFRRALGVVQFSNNKPEAAWLPSMQDRLSVLVQLAGIIGGDPQRYEVVNRIVVHVAGVDSVELWEFSVDKALDITVPAANMRVIKLTRKPRNEFDQRLEVWLAPQLGYLPIRIRQSDEQNPDANFTDLSLKRLP